MSELTHIPMEGGRRWRFDQVLPALFSPKRAFGRIAESETGLWQTPIALLALTNLIHALVAGGIRQAASASGQIEFPPGWEYYTPEQQAQFMQAASATSGPVFAYLLPAVMAVLGVYLSWLLLGWLLHLLLTLLGGRGSSQQLLNVTAWAMLPFVIRGVVRVVAMWSRGTLLDDLGLSGFAPAETGTAAILLAAFLALVDLYLFWHIGLLAVGSRLAANVSRAKAWMAVLLTMVIVLALRLMPALLAAQLGGLTVMRPFF